MVNANVSRLAESAQATLEGRDPMALVTVAASTSIGVISAQRITDRVMGLLNMPMDPQSATEFGASIVIKALIAVGFGVLAANLGGLAMIAAAFAGLGALASAGVDLAMLVLNVAPGGSARAASRGNQPRQGGRNSASATVENGASAQAATAGGGNSFR